MRKIIVLDGYAANPGDFNWDGLTQLGECTIYDRTANNEILDRIKDAEIILTNKTPITATTIEQSPHLKYIGVIATGYNIVDIEAAKKRGIVVTNIPAYSTNSVAQLTFAHLLNIAQRVQTHSDEVKKGRWSSHVDFTFWDTPLIELFGQKMGIIGLGNTGMATAKIALGFGLTVCAYTSKKQDELPQGIEKIELNDLFKTCDIISLHCPLNSKTQGMINKESLSLMKPNAILLNTARGGLINEKDLADALNNNQIYAAGIDVLTEEPPQADNPLIATKNCFITPHFAWASFSARERLMKILLANIKAYIDGAPINNVAQ